MGDIFKNYTVFNEGKLLRSEISNFIINNHYKKSARSLKPQAVFSLYYEDCLVGIAVFGQPTSKTTMEKYSNCVELRRFCLLNSAPKNSESYFLGKCIRIIKKLNLASKIITYADPVEGHVGIIYKATNFKYLGQGKGVNMTMVTKQGVQIPIRQVYAKSKFGGYNKSALSYQKMLKTGKAKLLKLPSKHIYMYELKAA